MIYEAWPYVHEEAKGMTPPPNAIRCPCGRGWLRQSSLSVRCDHSGRYAVDCAPAVQARKQRRYRFCIDLGGGSHRIETLESVRTWPYVTTKEAPDEP